QKIVGQFLLALTGVQFGDQPMPPGVNRVAPPVDAESPQPDPVGGEPAVKHIGFQTHRHRQRQWLDPLLINPAVAFGDRLFGRLNRFDSPRLRYLRIAWPEVTHDRGCRDGLVTLSPYRGADRHDLTDHGFRGIRATGNDRLDVIDLDTTGHHHSVRSARFLRGPLAGRDRHRGVFRLCAVKPAVCSVRNAARPETSCRGELSGWGSTVATPITNRYPP